MPENTINATKTVETVKVDIKDRKIIRELDMNARMGIKELAKRVGLSRQVVQYRLERMKRDGLLFGAITVFDSTVVGWKWFRIVIQLQKISQKQKQEFTDYLANHPNSMWVGEVGGNWDFVFNFVARDQFEFNALFEQLLQQWGSFVQKYEILTYLGVRDQPRRYLLPDYEMKSISVRAGIVHEMRFNPEIRLDGLDKQIIALLSMDAWLSFSEIGAKLKVNYKTIQNRVKILEKSKLIIRYRLLIRPRSLGYESNMVFLGVHSYKPELEIQLQEFLRHQNVTFVVKQLGTWKFGFEIETKSIMEFQSFLVDLRARFADIISTYDVFPIFHDHVLNYFPKGALK